MAEHQKSESSQNEQKMNFGTFIAVGVGIGTALGVVFDNIAMGVALGAAFGTVLEFAKKRNFTPPGKRKSKAPE